MKYWRRQFIRHFSRLQSKEKAKNSINIWTLPAEKLVQQESNSDTNHCRNTGENPKEYENQTGEVRDPDHIAAEIGYNDKKIHGWMGWLSVVLLWRRPVNVGVKTDLKYNNNDDNNWPYSRIEKPVEL